MAANDYDDLPSFANYLQFNEETEKYDDLASFANYLQSNEETVTYDDLASFANFLQSNEADLASLAANREANSFALLDDEESDAKYSSRPLPLTAMTETQKKKLKKIEKAENKKQKKIKKAEKKKQKKQDQQSQNKVRTDNGRGRGCEGPVSARSSLNEQDGKLTGNKQHGKEQGVKQENGKPNGNKHQGKEQGVKQENGKPNGNKHQGNEQGLKHVEEPVKRVDRDVELVNEVMDRK
ncbi:hypothetical protein LguiA_009435 [Lonicera macranthoides]